MSHVDVAIVGAGISGLAVADSLIRSGRSVAVFEARSNVGGRIRSVDVAGGSADLGPNWYWPGEDRVARLVQDLGLVIHQQWTKGDALIAVDQGFRRVSGPVMPPAFRFTGGARGLVEGLMARLPAGTVTFKAPVRRLVSTDPIVSVHTDHTTVTAAAVVVAIPPTLAIRNGLIEPGALDPEVLRTASMTPVWMGNIVKAVAVYPEPFWRHSGLSGTVIAPNRSFGEIHDMSGPDGFPAMLFGFSQLALKDPAETFVEDLAAAFGAQALSPTATFATDWGSERYISLPGSNSHSRYDLFGSPHLAKPSWNGRLHWTSTETSRVAPGHIEGALAAAERTVANLLEE